MGWTVPATGRFRCTSSHGCPSEAVSAPGDEGALQGARVLRGEKQNALSSSWFWARVGLFVVCSVGLLVGKKTKLVASIPRVSWWTS